MAMHTRMQGTFTYFRTKVMVNRYRARNRHLWSEEETRQRRREDYLENLARDHDLGLIGEDEFSDLHPTLSTQVTKNLQLQIDDALALEESFLSTLPETTSLDGSESLDGDLLVSRIAYTDKTVQEVQELGAQLRNFTPDDPNWWDDDSDDDSDTSVSSSNGETNAINRYATKKKLTEGQTVVHHLYADYLADPSNPETQPPSVVLVEGCAGTGKSTLLHSVIDTAAYFRRKNLRTAFNAINAVAIRGETTVTYIPNFFKKVDGERLSVSEDFLPFTHDQMLKAKDKLDGVKLLIVDEVSNQAPFHLAQLSHYCQQGLNMTDKLFGGVPVLMVGDLSQLPPVKAGHSLTQALLTICEHEESQSPPK